jgi:hypothetical protein
MVGKNTLIISEEEMLRAVNLYFKELVSFGARDDSVVKSVRQKGAVKGRPFILEIDDKIVKKTNSKDP